MKTTDGYMISRQILFETGHGFVLAHAEDNNGFMVWQFTQTAFGRDYYHGHSFDRRRDAENDFLRRADAYGYLYKVEPEPRQEPARYYRYYSTQRPVDIGTYPKPGGNHPLVIVNYDEDRRRPVAGGRLCAWGELIYRQPLTGEQARAYELVFSPDNPDENGIMV